MNTEELIHAGVRLNTPKSKPPILKTELIGPDSVGVTYRRPRRLCAVARGILRGCAAHYRVEITIVDARCMWRGDSDCYITMSGEEL